jgi:hypothetical protein
MKYLLLIMFLVGCINQPKDSPRVVSIQQDSVHIECKEASDREYCRFSTKNSREFCMYNHGTHNTVIPCDFYGDM